MRATLTLACILGTTTATAYGQTPVGVPLPAPVTYEVSFPNAAHHEAEINVAFRALEDGPLTVRMSRASPGRYALHEFAKNVYELKATTPEGAPLTISRTTPYAWTIEGHSGDVDVTYTLYADRADGTYSQVDRTHAHLNAPATYLWAEGLENSPVEIRFDPAEADWTVATQLFPADDPFAFTAPDLQYFMDSPTQLAALDYREWQIADGQTIRIALHHNGTSEDFDKLTEMTKKVVDEQIKVFGSAPQFDNGVYTFIAVYVPHASRDGMEHRNSTILTRPDSLFKGEFKHLGTISHEFLHAWNVERLRPADLEPFDFTRANPSRNLWFAEGFTSYYGPLTIRRAGEQSVEEYLSDLGGTLSRIINAPGRKLRSPRDMSLQAPFVDAATAVDRANFDNVFVSYYPYGAMIGLALDLSLRSTFEDTTLDDYMRLLWTRYGETDTLYTHEDLRKTLADLTGDQAFADQFFEAYIETGGLPDYGPLLERAGLRLELANPGKASLGRAAYAVDGEAVTLTRPTLRGTPIYTAGLDRDDEIVSIGRTQINSAEDVTFALAQYAPGDEVEIAYIQRGITRTAMMALVEDPSLKITMMDNPSRRQRRFRKAWLGD
ncbi:MAG: M61 family peptidase [Pseudomonadota bacterium]